MILKQKPLGHWRLRTSPWAIIGSVVILLIVVVVFAVQNYNRERQYMSLILAEKGTVIAKAVEAGARTGMMGMMWGRRQVQTLIEETAQLPGVLYITETNRDGQVQASSTLVTDKAIPAYRRNNLKPLPTTSRLAPMSANTAIHMVA
ncbi:MAG: hypothetical protein OEL83_14880 [Desulforhopalus sp.]|nr:hypothetical protein [Desulforhopalus sp.]